MTDRLMRISGHKFLWIAMITMTLWTIAGVGSSVAQEEHPQGTGIEQTEAAASGGLAKGLVALAASLAIGLTALATGMAQARIGAAGVGAIAENPKRLGAIIMLVAIPETVAILGFVVAYLILS